VKGVWHCHCLHPKIFRQVQTTDKSQYRTKEERKEGEKEERKKELHFHQMGVAA